MRVAQVIHARKLDKKKSLVSMENRKFKAEIVGP